MSLRHLPSVFPRASDRCRRFCGGVNEPSSLAGSTERGAELHFEIGFLSFHVYLLIDPFCPLGLQVSGLKASQSPDTKVSFPTIRVVAAVGGAVASSGQSSP